MKIRTAKDIGIVIQERRRLLGLSQEALARRIGVTRQWVMGLERGRARPDLGFVLRAMRVLGLAIEVRAESPTSSVKTPEKSLVDTVLHRSRRVPS